MKKIPLWKLFLFGLITLGIYYIVWLAKRRNELQAASKKPIPHWVWLVVPPILSFVLLFPIAIISFALTNSEEGAVTLTLGMFFLFLIAVLCINIWWAWRFSAVMATAIYRRVTPGWAIVYWFLGGPLIVYIWQFYLNRLPKLRASHKPHRPTVKFIILSVITLIVLVTLNVWSTAVSFSDAYKEIEKSTQAEYYNEQQDDYSQLDQQSRDLQRQYDSCTEHLDLDFPVVTNENEAAYNKAYDTCDKIYRKLDKIYRSYTEENVNKT